MGVRRDKMQTLLRYLVGSTGITSLSLDGMNIVGAYPYRFTTTTSRKLQNWHDDIRGNNEPRQINIHIRYDNTVDTVDEAWVGMRLDDFVKLLTAHAEQTQDRRN